MGCEDSGENNSDGEVRTVVSTLSMQVDDAWSFAGNPITFPFYVMKGPPV